MNSYPSTSELPSRLVVSVGAGTAREMIDIAQSVFANGADMVELRVDGLPESEVARLASSIASCPPERVVITCRSSREGGQCDRPAAERVRLVKRIAEAQTNAAGEPGWVDFELADFSEDSDLMLLLGSAPAAQIISHHDLKGLPEKAPDVLARCEALAASVKGVGKLAWSAGGVCDCFDAFELMRANPGDRVVIAMGEQGLLSRVLAKKFGAWGTFCAATGADAMAPGQVSLADMLGRYRWGRQTSSTRVLGVLGNPVGHSLSPAIFNRQFDAADFDGVYVPIRVNGEAELRDFLDGCVARSWLDVLGFSVTVPHKESALRWLGENVEPLARRIGAVNTLHFEAGVVRGYNTDYVGALTAIVDGMGIAGSELSGLPVCVLGAGGVARAVVAGLRDRGARIEICNRSQDRAQALAEAFDCQVRPWSQRAAHQAQLIINCTSVGMHPHVDESPMPDAGFRDSLVAFDTIYNPRETRFLKQARHRGCRTIDGVAMFVRQAAEQYRIWTGNEANLDLMRSVVTESRI